MLEILHGANNVLLFKMIYKKFHLINLTKFLKHLFNGKCKWRMHIITVGTHNLDIKKFKLNNSKQVKC